MKNKINKANYTNIHFIRHSKKKAKSKIFN